MREQAFGADVGREMYTYHWLSLDLEAQIQGRTEIYTHRAERKKNITGERTKKGTCINATSTFRIPPERILLFHFWQKGGLRVAIITLSSAQIDGLN